MVATNALDKHPQWEHAGEHPQARLGFGQSAMGRECRQRQEQQRQAKWSRSTIAPKEAIPPRLPRPKALHPSTLQENLKRRKIFILGDQKKNRPGQNC
jgi:hypothetical protein